MKIEFHEGIKLRNSAIVVLMDESQVGVKQLHERLNDATQKVELQINEHNTEYMIVGRRNWVDCGLKVGYFRFKKVNSFKYLSTIVSEKNDITKEVASRIQAGN